MLERMLLWGLFVLLTLYRTLRRSVTSLSITTYSVFGELTL